MPPSRGHRPTEKSGFSGRSPTISMDFRNKSLAALLEYLRMPMGIKNSPATCKCLMDVVLKGMHRPEVFVYLDDIVIHSAKLEEQFLL